jgi:formylglycine-generating enzyme required for sulfatase activity
MLVALLSHSLLAQSNNFDLQKNKRWSYITGEQRAVNDSNRVNYWCDPFPGGARVTSFNNMKLIDLHDSQFAKVHLDANQVYEAQKTVTGPSFFISKYEVSNNDYLEFVEDCIVTWMKENRPEIAKKYKLESPEYLNEVAKWLANDTVLISREIKISHWTELDQKYPRMQLEWEKITYKGVYIFPHMGAWERDYQLLGGPWNGP